ncbi:MAG: BatD family protein [Pontiella sp.]|nr:BatD family protein [Pontiella sp.]
MKLLNSLFIAWALAAGIAWADSSLYAYAYTTETNVFLGQVFTLDIIVKTPQLPDSPDIGDLTDFNVTVLEEGKATSEPDTWAYRFALRAKHAGDLTIPALRFGSVSSEPVSIQARKPEATDRMKRELQLSSISVFVGEPVLLTTTWHSSYPFGAIKAVDFHFPVLNDKRFQILERYAPDKEEQAGSTGLPVHGTRVLASRKNYMAEEVQHQSLTFSKLLIPKKSGRIIIPPATLLCAAEREKDLNNRQRRSAFQYPAYFDNTFFDQNVTGDTWSRIYTESRPLILDVKPLPAEGRPDLFNGMVGNFSIHTTAEPVDVRVGDPITLAVTVTASDFMEGIFFPPLRYQPLLVNRFEIPSDRSLPERRARSKIYTQTIRPRSIDTAEIPPIQLAFFNPVSNAYCTVQSDPVPIRISPAQEIGIFGEGTRHSRLQAVEEGIRQNYENPDMLQSRPRPLLGWAHPIITLSILLLPPLLVGGISLVSLFGEKKHHIHRTAKAARAYKVFRKNAAHIYTHSMKSEIYGDLDQILRAYLGDRLHLTPGALSYRDAEARLIEAGADAQILDDFKRLFALCEAYRFTTRYDEKAQAKPIVHEAIRIIKSLEHALK